MRNDSDMMRRPIKVCFVIDKLSRAGTENQLLLMIAQLDRKKVEPYLCLLDGTDQLSTDLLPERCEVLRLGVTKLLSRRSLQQACVLKRFLTTRKIDVVQTYFPDSTRFAAPIAKAAGVGVVLGSRRDTGYWFRRTDYLIARVYNKLFIDSVIANSEAARQSAIRQERIAANRVAVVPNMIDLERFNQSPPWKPSDVRQSRKVGMVGNLRPVKGPDLLIRAAHMVLEAFPDTQFEIAGGGDRAPYQSLINELGIAERVQLVGSVTDVPSFLTTLDVAVLPSRAEGLSNALMEYMAAGRPIVATDVGGNRELIRSGENGFLVDATHCELALAINTLIADSYLAQALSRCAHQDIALVASRASKQMEDLYVQAVCSVSTLSRRANRRYNTERAI